MHKKVYLFRHGETDWNAEGRFQGHIDIPLNSTGKDQAKAMIPLLSRENIDAILSSDLIRAAQTAEIIATHLGVPVFSDQRLREAFLGKAQGLRRDEIEAQFGAELAARWRSIKVTDADISYPDGETGNQIIQRTLEALQEFMKSTEFQRVGISTHGGVIRRVMQHVLPEDSSPVPIPNGVIYVLDYNSESQKLHCETAVPLNGDPR